MYFLDDNEIDPHLLKQQLRHQCLIRSYQMDTENYQPDREDDEICDSVSECIAYTIILHRLSVMMETHYFAAIM